MREITLMELDDGSGTFAHVRDERGVIFKTRLCRLSVQARRLAQDWIDEQDAKPAGDITLSVQNLSIDSNLLFGRKQNG